MKLYLGSPQLERRFRWFGSECSRLLRKTAAPAALSRRRRPSTELQQVTQSLRTRKKEAVRPSQLSDSPPPLLLSITIRSSSSSRAQGQRRQKMRLSRRNRSIRMKRVGTTVCKRVECG